MLESYKKPYLRKLKNELMKNPKQGYMKMNLIIDEFCKKNNIDDFEEYKIERHEQISE